MAFGGAGRGHRAPAAIALFLLLPTVALALPVDGAWGQFRGDAPKTGNVDDAVAPRANGWVFDGGTGSQIVASPVTDGFTVVVADYQGQLSGLDALDGTQLWSQRTPESVTATPAIIGDLVLVPSGRSLLGYAVQPSGASVVLEWSFNASARIDSPPTVAGGFAYFGSDDRNLYKVSLGTGQLAWTYTVADVVKSSPAVDGTHVYFGAYDGTVYALRDEGTNVSLDWSYDVGSAVAGSPAVSGGVLYVCTLAGHVFAIDATTGARRWQADPGGVIVSSPAVVDDLLIIGGDTLAALDRQNGVTVWDRTLGGYVRSSPAASGDLIFVGDYAGRLFAYAPNGSLAWAYDTGSAIRTSPAVGGGLVFVGNDDGRLLALPLEGGLAPEVQALTPRETFEGVRETFAAVGSDPEGRDLVYSWTFDDGTSAQGRVVSHAFSAAGNYTVEVAASDGQQTTSRSAVVTVRPFASTISGGETGGTTGGSNAGLYVGAAVAAAAAAAGLFYFFVWRRRFAPPREEFTPVASAAAPPSALRSPPPFAVAPAPQAPPKVAGPRTPAPPPAAPARPPAPRAPATPPLRPTAPPPSPPPPAKSPPAAPSEFDYYKRSYGGQAPAKDDEKKPRGPRRPPQ